MALIRFEHCEEVTCKDDRSLTVERDGKPVRLNVHQLRRGDVLRVVDVVSDMTEAAIEMHL